MTKTELLEKINSFGVNVTLRTVQGYAQNGLIDIREAGGGAGVQTEYDDYAPTDFLVAYELMNSNKLGLKVSPKEAAGARKIFKYVHDHLSELSSRTMVANDSYLSEVLDKNPKQCLVAQEYLNLQYDTNGDVRLKRISRNLTQFFMKSQWGEEE